ncbi:MAG: SDR family NAD(P)-dependent oxidoreductase [Betaproteobacteria bacterium]|nr:SDR family NAD(P)-dependent oxidoreductase [Betaproteobacteria bacterium]
MRLKNRHIIVTGGAQGIGLACALRFAQEGAQVLVIDKQKAPSSPPGPDAGLSAAEGSGASAEAFSAIHWMQADASERSCAQEALARGVGLWGKVDGLVNNAGIIHGCHFLDLRDEDFDREIDMPKVNDYQITYKGKTTAPARAIVEQHHLEWFINPAEDIPDEWIEE